MLINNYKYLAISVYCNQCQIPLSNVNDFQEIIRYEIEYFLGVKKKLCKVYLSEMIVRQKYV